MSKRKSNTPAAPPPSPLDAYEEGAFATVRILKDLCAAMPAEARAIHFLPGGLLGMAVVPFLNQLDNFLGFVLSAVESRVLAHLNERRQSRRDGEVR